MMDEIKRYLTVEEVARRFKVNPTTIYRLVYRGKIPAFKVGNQWRFSQEKLAKWVANQIDTRFLVEASDVKLSWRTRK